MTIINYRLGKTSPAFPTNSPCIIGIYESGGEFAIAADDKNADYQKYLAWVADGNTPDPAE